MAVPSIGRDLLNVPMGDMIRDMAFAIADAQIKLDANSIEVAQMMGGLKTIVATVGGEDKVTFEDSRIFFGRETVTLSAALDIYNTTSSSQLSGAITTDVITPNTADIEDFYDRPHVHATTVPTTTLVAPADTYVIVAGDIYDWGTSGPYAIPDPLPTPAGKQLKEGVLDRNVTIPARISMLELGFAPTFYQFVDTIIEVKINISITEERESGVSAKSAQFSSQSSTNFRLFKKPSIKKDRAVNVAQVNASYSNKYSYSAEGSSLLRTKLTPIPPPSILEERIRDLMEQARNKPE